MLCHGQGDPNVEDQFLGGCCFVANEVCPNRWFIDYSAVPGGNEGDVTIARVLDSDRNDLGSVDDVARSLVGNNPNRRQRVYDAVQGTRFVCTAGVSVVESDPSLLNDRPAFNAAWAAAIRASAPSLPVGWEDYCPQFGPTNGRAGQCCFREDQATNDARAALLTTTAVELRRSATGAS